MSRTVRATIAALFGYARFVSAFAIGLALVPFILHHLGATMYGYWLASGELMAYAALAEFGVLVTLPWLIAEADGRGDRDRIRELVTTGGGAALLSAAVCLLSGTSETDPPMQEGVDAFVRKPFDISHLNSTVRRLSQLALER